MIYLRRGTLQEGQKLIIPAAVGPISERAAGRADPLIRSMAHDTVASNPDEFRRSVLTFRKWNGFRSNHVSKGVAPEDISGRDGSVPPIGISREIDDGLGGGPAIRLHRSP